MATDHIRYDILAQEALRGVVRTVLADAARNGLPGEHHFKITFNTAAPGVRLSDRMRAQYPEAMTIILQHQFWDLAIKEDSFEVGLSFGGVPECLAVPFEAITAFYDPAAQFGFQFEPLEGAAGEDAADKGPAGKTAGGKSAASKFGETPARPAGLPASNTEALPAPAASESQEPPPDRDGGADGGGAEVVRLDRFRKK